MPALHGWGELRVAAPFRVRCAGRHGPDGGGPGRVAVPDRRAVSRTRLVRMPSRVRVARRDGQPRLLRHERGQRVADALGAPAGARGEGRGGERAARVERGRPSLLQVQQQRNQRGLEANSEYFAATLAPLAGQSKERCSGHGVWAPAGGMPAKGVPAGKCEKKGSCRCLCYPGYDGDACERSTAVVPRHFCLNGCSGRGECFRNWCRCEPGAPATDDAC